MVRALALLLLLESCHLGPKYERPAVEVPDHWKNDGTEQVCSKPYENFWWNIFEDELLNDLEIEAITNSPTLQAALERVASARSLAGVKKADLYPQITLDPSYTDSGMLFKFFTPPGVTLPTTSQVFRIHQFQYTLPLDMYYELDLWGKLSGQYTSALRSAQAQEEAFRVSLLTLTADLASSYFSMRSLDAQIANYESSIEEFRKSYNLAKNRFEKGLVSKLDELSASTELTDTEANLADLRRQRILEENKIALLLGRPPSGFCAPSMPLQGAPPAVPPGLPSTVMLQRPDIAEAERTMAAEHALIGVAYASFFPSVELTGSIGYLSPTFEDFLKWISRYWLMGVNVHESIFDGGRNCENLREAYANYRAANEDYQQQVLVAFREVEDALSNLKMQALQAESLALSVKSSEEALQISYKRYSNGLTPYQQVIDSQKAALNAERNYIYLQGVRYLSTIQLIKALGGSW